MASEISYEEKVKIMLQGMEKDSIVVLVGVVAPANLPRFTQAVKSYIDNSLGNTDGWQILANNDWTKIRKDIYLWQ